MAVLSGDTVQLTVEFKTFAGAYADPTDISLTIYDTNKNIVTSYDLVSPTNTTGTGQWFYNYTVPDGYKELIYEFSGTLESTTILSRKILPITWVGK